MASEDRVQENDVVTMHYTLTVDDEVWDSTEDQFMEPIQFLIGQGLLIPGLERALYGMKVGDRRHIHLGPEMAYGEVDEEAFATVRKKDMPPEVPLKEGVELEMSDDEGDVIVGQIVQVKGDKVLLDFNHPLAGKTLDFEIEVLDRRPATEEEIAHGHVHADPDESD
ncbi:MAG: peptidylprolyl isomerase [Anaerolineales bacterium]|jgi:FKBP-type peptidyl-prolyl cis-trans isomerase SlyD